MYDNNCDEHDYCLSREPLWFTVTEFNVDEPHFRGHTACCSAYNTALYPHVECAPMAEQQNKRLRMLENHLSYMRQARALWYLRYFLYLMNEREGDRAAGICF